MALDAPMPLLALTITVPVERLHQCHVEQYPDFMLFQTTPPPDMEPSLMEGVDAEATPTLTQPTGITEMAVELSF